jgi:hypothetical protein
MFSSFDPDSKNTDDKLEQSVKQISPIKRTVRGIKIDSREEQRPNASSWISVNSDSDSNVTAERGEQSEKELVQRISTDAGM